MSKLKFNDEYNIDASGELRPLKLSDGWYVVGQEMIIPVDSHKEAIQMIENIKQELGTSQN